jgi:hypothetical protein
MPNKITETNILPTQFVSRLSRYSGSKVIYYGNANRITFNTYKKSPIVESSEDRFTIITAGTEYRPDLVSRDMYGTVELWYKILEYNQINDIFDFTAGRSIRLPANFF